MVGQFLLGRSLTPMVLLKQVADALQRPVKVISAPDAERKDAYRLWLALEQGLGRFCQSHP
jgi:hypothetical protein